METYSEIEKDKIRKIRFCNNSIDAIDEASAIAIITEWEEFKSIKTSKFIFDGRNISKMFTLTK